MATQRKKKSSKTKSSVSRRKFMQSAIAASVATSAVGVLSETSTAVAHSGHKSMFSVLSVEQGNILTAVLNRLVPAEGKMPGAGDVGIAHFIDGVLRDAPHLRQPILDVLSEVHVSQPSSDAELDDVLGRVQRDQEASFLILLDATYTGYYSNLQVLQVVGWVPPADEVRDSEFFNVALLDEVRQRGQKYRSV
jgi:hypothetical protein